jgi:hypothetical protein
MTLAARFASSTPARHYGAATVMERGFTSSLNSRKIVGRHISSAQHQHHVTPRPELFL